MQAFEYQAATSLADAVAAVKAGAKPIAGGQTLLQTMKIGLATPESLVDLNGIDDLRRIEVNGNAVKVGALATHASVAASGAVRQAIPALADLAAHIGDRQVRARGTIGGSLANSDPAACYPAAVLGLGATIHTDRRTIAADDYFLGLYETALEDGELITAVSFPVPQKAAWQKFRQPASHFSLVGVFVSQGPQGVRVAVTGAGACAFRVKSLEDRLAQGWSPQACDGVKVDAGQLNSDLHGSAEYRAALIPVLAGRAVAATLGS